MTRRRSASSSQDKVADLIALAQVQPGGVQALKNQLGIVICVKADIDDFQAANPRVQLVNLYVAFKDYVELAKVETEPLLADLLRYARRISRRQIPAYSWSIVISCF